LARFSTSSTQITKVIRKLYYSGYIAILGTNSGSVWRKGYLHLPCSHEDLIHTMIMTLFNHVIY